jgi:hypothetical protein
MADIVNLINYSEKAIAIFGNTKDYKEAILAIGGKFNPSLKYEEDRSPGWIFSKTNRAKVEKLVNDINNGKCKPVASKEAENVPAVSKKSSSVPLNFVDKKAFLALTSRLEQLEQELSQIKKHLNLPNKEVNTFLKFEDNIQDEDGGDIIPAPRLLKKRVLKV